MGFVLCGKKCPRCNVNYVYESFCCGDWYNTIYGYVHQAFCPKCGYMIPPISKKNPFYISNNGILELSRMLSIHNNIKFQETKKIAKGLSGFNDFNIVIKVFSEKLDIPIDEVSKLFTELISKKP